MVKNYMMEEDILEPPVSIQNLRVPQLNLPGPEEPSTAAPTPQPEI